MGAWGNGRRGKLGPFVDQYVDPWLGWSTTTTFQLLFQCRTLSTGRFKQSYFSKACNRPQKIAQFL